MRTHERLIWLGFFATLIAIALLLMPSAAERADAGPAVIIDGFDVAQSLTAGVTNPVFSTVSGGTNLIGGYRKLWVYRTSGSGNLQAVANSPTSRYTHSPDSDVRGISKITWDGTGGDPTVLNFSLNANFSSEHGIFIGLEHADNVGAVFTVTLYTNNANYCSRAVKNPPNTVNSNLPALAVIFKWSDFSTACSSGGVTLSDVDAIVLEVDTTSVDGNDIRFLFIEATKMDLGDLPTSYKATTSAGDFSYTTLESGATHAYSGLMLGSHWDGETAGQPDTNAVGDDSAGGTDDEDGVQVNSTNYWSAGQQVSVTVTINGGDGCLSAWIDWNKNNAFASTERVITNATVSTGSYVYTFTVPTGVTEPYVYFSRWRLFPRPGIGSCPSTPLPYFDVLGFDPDGNPTGYTHYAGGEVEDHKIGRAPTAVTLSSLTANSEPLNTLVLIAGVGVVGGAFALGLFARRRRR